MAARSSRMLSLAAAASLLAAASALQSIPAPGVPCATVDRSSPAYSTCDGGYVSIKNYYALMKAGQLNLNALSSDTARTRRAQRCGGLLCPASGCPLLRRAHGSQRTPLLRCGLPIAHAARARRRARASSWRTSLRRRSRARR